ncbi:MAG TPA: glycosyltransferase [Casimicrobiaceae bacterium]|nr:glycosyltransferase [Casimicrobiaceae bacterium]
MPGLVSIVTRTLGRPCLADAAASVAAQTHRPLEWLVVDASGKGIDAPSAAGVQVRIVSAGEAMRPSRAANAGLAEARGARAMILDDDDLLLPLAAERLSAALDAAPDAHVAYGDVRLAAEDGREIGRMGFEFSELVITRRNLFPVNGGMFDLAFVRANGVRFDEGLDWYDDWQFWLSLSERTAFVHVREVVAVYRTHLSQSGMRDVDAAGGDPRIREQRDIVLARGAPRRAALEARHAALKRDAAAFATAGRWQEAASAWAAAHASYPYDAEPLLRYAEIALRAGDMRAARAIVDSGLALLPAEPSLHRLHATLLQRQGDREGAEAALERARTLEAQGPVSPI